LPWSNRTQAILALVLQPTSHEISEIDTDLGQQGSMFVHNVKTFLPDGSSPLHAAELATQQSIEAVEV
jgi:hypothetical protein